MLLHLPPPSPPRPTTPALLPPPNTPCLDFVNCWPSSGLNAATGSRLTCVAKAGKGCQIAGGQKAAGVKAPANPPELQECASCDTCNRFWTVCVFLRPSLQLSMIQSAMQCCCCFYFCCITARDACSVLSHIATADSHQRLGTFLAAFCISCSFCSCCSFCSSCSFCSCCKVLAVLQLLHTLSSYCSSALLTYLGCQQLSKSENSLF